MKNEDGWKNIMFRGEYGVWFRIFLPSKVEAGYPLPFGGTTNFFRYTTLKELEEDFYGPWDGYNLTEDFDLGIRLFKKDRNKFKVTLIDSITYEEFSITWEGWLKQRTRWQQGRIQTLQKCLKEFISDPENAVKNFSKTYVILMECSTPHLGAINIIGIFLFVYVFAYISEINFELVKFLMLYNLGSIVYYSVFHGIGYYIVAKEDKILKKELLKNTLIVTLTAPLYWIPQWIADLRALKRQYIDKLSDWEKTQHYGIHIEK